MFTSTGRFRPTRRAALIAAAIVLAAASGASARSGGPSASGNGSHAEAGHRASLASHDRVMSPPIIVVMKPGHGHHHHHVRIRFFDDWYWASACIAHHPERYDDAARRVDWRWYGLARCHVVDDPVLY
jgi:hypothetical protein